MIEIGPDAVLERLAARDYYEQQRRGLGEIFRAAADRTLDAIEEAPRSYGPTPRSPDLSLASLAPWRFPSYRFAGFGLDLPLRFASSARPRATTSVIASVIGTASERNMCTEACCTSRLTSAFATSGDSGLSVSAI